MDAVQRFEILSTIASGDFATVYRARDRELGREVAIKQIHAHYLHDPEQLERYWQEAQLLAALQHPNILTVYDIVRSHGWLVLELLRGTMQQTTQRATLDADRVRFVLLCGLNALRLLHGNGILHGDVKPSNLLVDSRGLVKLGDFGLARRVNNELGSLLKGTAKYIAPETVSEQFGPVGPASDLYSLGFSAYELLCGPRFDSMFPHLQAYGRDRQAAWITWHAAPDRRLPPLARILVGVPTDLAQVIERLVAKDVRQRYASASEAMDDLRGGVATPPRVPRETPDEPSPQPLGLRQKAAVMCAVISSLCLTAWIMQPVPTPKLATQDPQSVAGMVRMVDTDRHILVLDLPDGTPLELRDFSPEDRFYVNDRRSLLAELRQQDQVALNYIRGDDGRRVMEVYATRPRTITGELTAVHLAAGTITVAAADGDKDSTVRVPYGALIDLNGEQQLAGQPVALTDLCIGDRVTVSHAVTDDEYVAISMAVTRSVQRQGVIRGIDPTQRTLMFEEVGDAETIHRSLALASECPIRLNNSDTLDGRLLSADDLRPGDRATLTCDTRVTSISATRVVSDSATVQAVQANTLTVLVDGRTQPREFLVDESCQVTLGGDPVSLEALRRGDLVTISHDAPSEATPHPHAVEVKARRVEDATRWAILVGVQNHDDATLTGVRTAANDVQHLRDMLVKRYAVPWEQSLVLTDPSLIQLRQGVNSLLARVQESDSLIFYFGGCAVREPDGPILLMPKEFQREQAAATGLSVEQLVEQLEACASRNKVMILDVRSGERDVDVEAPTGAKILAAITPSLRTLAGIANGVSAPNDTAPEEGVVGRFAAGVTDAYGGSADTNRDGHLEVVELVEYLNKTLTSADSTEVPSAVVALPDTTPKRLSEEALQAIRELSTLVNANKANRANVRTVYDAASRVAGNQPEPALLYGIYLLREKEWAEAETEWQRIRGTFPTLALPAQGLAWTHFQRRNQVEGLAYLTELVDKLSLLKPPSGTFSGTELQILKWVGQLREFVAADQSASVNEDPLRQLDAKVNALGEQAVRLYESGREATRTVSNNYENRLETANPEQTQQLLRVFRGSVHHFATFPVAEAVQGVLTLIEK
jgi:serine/threonine-protein kinase